MGRTTTPLKQLIYGYIERWIKASKLLDQREASHIEEFLEDIDSTISLFTHIGTVDPLEVLLFHIMRKAARRGGGFG